MNPNITSTLKVSVVKVAIVGIGLFSCDAFSVMNPTATQYPTAGANIIVTRIGTADEQSTVSTDSSESLESPSDSIKTNILSLAEETKRGFTATSKQRSQVSTLIKQLSDLNPSSEPAQAFYEGTDRQPDDDESPTLSGKWTLVYTDAPDITTLDPNLSSIPSLLPSNVKLGRIGQECIPEESTIKNVIEWRRPDWLKGVLEQIGRNAEEIDGSSGQGSRVLQKVCCEAKGSPSQPSKVDLKLTGFELLGNVDNGVNDDLRTSGILPSLEDIVVHGPAALFEKNPLRISGPLSAPFGQFELLYLDSSMRIIKTGQGFYAVNVREEKGDEWF